jgi:hypothetical protein
MLSRDFVVMPHDSAEWGGREATTAWGRRPTHPLLRPHHDSLRQNRNGGSIVAKITCRGDDVDVIIQVRGSLNTETRLMKPIKNYFDRSELTDGKKAECANWEKKHPSADHRRGAASSSYNCHGLTFGSRRTGIDDPAAVREILQHDDYVKIDRKDLLPGDTVIYIDNEGDITHSGIVIEVPPLGAKILSKWGECQEVIHLIGDCPYPETTKEFYRVCK